MAESWQFRIRYWGATGSFTKALLPEEFEGKLAAAIAYLCEHGELTELVEHSSDEEATARFLHHHLPYHLRSTYGGNTTCVEVRTPDAQIVLDSGSGFREFGVELNRRWNAPDYKGQREAHIILTHAHMDHTFATPFFDPYFDDRNDFTLWGPQTAIDSLNAVLDPTSPLRSIYFPPTYDMMGGIKRIRTIEPGDNFQIGQTQVDTYALNHPGGCLAYRFRRNGRTVVFASDHEVTDAPDRDLANFAAGADLLYSDAQYTDREYKGEIGIEDDMAISRIGWGHSSVEASVATGALARVRRLHLGHHDPKRSDAGLQQLEQYAEQIASAVPRQAGGGVSPMEVRLACEGLTVEI